MESDKGRDRGVAPVQADREAGPLQYVISPDAVDCPLDDGLAVFDSRTGTYFSLNRTAALIWNGARIRASRADLHEVLTRSVAGATADDLDADLDAVLGDFVDAGLFLAVFPDGSAPLV